MRMTTFTLHTPAGATRFTDADPYEGKYVTSIVDVLQHITLDDERPVSIEAVPAADVVRFHFADDADIQWGFTVLPWGLFCEVWNARRQGQWS